MSGSLKNVLGKTVRPIHFTASQLLSPHLFGILCEAVGSALGLGTGGRHINELWRKSTWEPVRAPAEPASPSMEHHSYWKHGQQPSDGRSELAIW